MNEKLDRHLWDELAQSPLDAGRSSDLPPFLMVLDEVVPVGIAPAGSPASRAKLAECAGESFFMAYTSLLRQDQLSAQRSRRLQAYLAARQQGLAELRRALAEAGEMPAASQADFLAGFARTQSPALSELEAEEESIRLDLTTRGTFRQYEDGHGLPVSQPEERKIPPVATELVFAVQFEPGLTATQRELLLGIAQDLDQSDKQAGSSFSFWPARARLPLPAAMPADLIARLQRVQQLKLQLVRELMEVLDRAREQKDEAGRAQALALLAKNQAPTLDSLNSLADEIRPRLIELYIPAPAAPAGVPPKLLRQLGQAYARKTALQRGVIVELRELRRLLPNDKVALVQRGQIPAIEVTAGAPSNTAPKLTAAESKALGSRLKKTNDELERRTLALTKEIQDLQKSLQEYRDRTLKSPDLNLNQLAVTLAQTVAAQENDRLYRDYRAAVLQPGLSLEQRRLLLRGALVDIEQARLRDPWVE